jgi:probable addiction module antidote protein
MINKNEFFPVKIAKSKLARVAKFRDTNEVFMEELSKSKEDQELYLQIALEDYEQDGNLDFFLMALRNIAIARGGMTELSKKTKMNRQSLYKALSKKGNPGLATIDTILKSLGFKLTIQMI